MTDKTQAKRDEFAQEAAANKSLPSGNPRIVKALASQHAIEPYRLGDGSVL